MKKSVERITGDSEGVAYEFPVFRFEGSDGAAPKAYLQAALHAGELPGTVAMDALMPLLEKAGREGRIRGSVTLVPWANPVGRAQYMFGEMEGRFHLGTRECGGRRRADAVAHGDFGLAVRQVVGALAADEVGVVALHLDLREPPQDLGKADAPFARGDGAFGHDGFDVALHDGFSFFHALRLTGFNRPARCGGRDGGRCPSWWRSAPRARRR